MVTQKPLQICLFSCKETKRKEGKETEREKGRQKEKRNYYIRK
jgi:hypothetical protein